MSLCHSSLKAIFKTAHTPKKEGVYAIPTPAMHIYQKTKNKIRTITIHSQSPLTLACLKYFIPTHATTTHTHAITAVRIISAG